jgi:hypothetical protein
LYGFAALDSPVPPWGSIFFRQTFSRDERRAVQSPLD